MSDDPTRSAPATDDPTGARGGTDDEGSVTTERLSEYLDDGRQPYDPLIEDDPEARAQLAALARLRRMTAGLLADDAAAEPTPDPSWFDGIMSRVRLESRSGREIPLLSADQRSSLHITEGAVRSLIREAGDSVPGVVVVSCGIVGDVTVPGSVVSVDVQVSALYGAPVPELAETVKAAVAALVAQQTELVVEAVDVTVRDVHLLDDDEAEAPR